MIRPTDEAVCVASDLGAVLVGLAESSSPLIGFQWLLAVAFVIYLGSWVCVGRVAEKPGIG